MFTKKLADPEYLKLREVAKRGESTVVDLEEVAADEGNESSKSFLARSNIKWVGRGVGGGLGEPGS